MGSLAYFRDVLRLTVRNVPRSNNILNQVYFEVSSLRGAKEKLSDILCFDALMKVGTLNIKRLIG